MDSSSRKITWSRTGWVAILAGTLAAAATVATTLIVGSPAVAIDPAPDAGFQLPGGAVPWDIAVGPDQRIYVTSPTSSRVFVFAADAADGSTPVATFTLQNAPGSPINAYGIDFAPNGDMWITSGPGNDVYAFPAIDVTGVEGDSILLRPPAFSAPGATYGVAFHDDYVFIPTQSEDAIRVLHKVGSSYFYYLQVFSPNGLKTPVNPIVVGDELVVSNNSGFASGGGMISRFALGEIEGHGVDNVAPPMQVAATSTIDGANTLANFTDYVVADCTGNLLVTNYGGAPGPININKFASDASGNVAPTASITDSVTRLQSAEGIAVDALGRTWVAFSQGGVLRFDFFASSCPRPSPEAQLPNTGMSAVTGWAALTGAAVVVLFGLGLVQLRRRVSGRSSL